MQVLWLHPLEILSNALLVVIFIFTVAFIETVNTASFLSELLTVGIKWMVFGIYLTAVYPIFRIDRTAGFKFRSITHYDRNFFIIRMNSFFHTAKSNLTFLFQFRARKYNFINQFAKIIIF